jgi:BMFP domain-containing protein YqiC
VNSSEEFRRLQEELVKRRAELAELHRRIKALDLRRAQAAKPDKKNGSKAKPKRRENE